MESKAREILSDFLGLYRSFTCLWDVNDAKYSHRPSRNNALLILLEQYKKFDKAATVTTIKKKLENMRTSYRRERKKVQESGTTESGTQEVYIPTLWYYDHLTFLDDKDEVLRDGRDSVKLENSIDCIQDEAETDSDLSYTEPSMSDVKLKKKRRINNNTSMLNDSKNILRHRLQRKEESMLDASKNVLKHPLQRKRESIVDASQNSLRHPLHRKQESMLDGPQYILKEPECSAEAYAYAVGQQLKELSNGQRCIAEKLIADIVFNGKLNRLTVDSTLSLCPSPSPSKHSDSRSHSASSAPSPVNPVSNVSNIVLIPDKVISDCLKFKQQ